MHFNWPEAFLLTQVIEMPIYIWILRRDRQELTVLNMILIAFGASAITHPFVWFVFPKIDFLWRHYPLFFLVVETFAWSVEGCYFKLFKVKHPWLVSFFGNAMSAGIGLFLNSDIFSNILCLFLRCYT